MQQITLTMSTACEVKLQARVDSRLVQGQLDAQTDKTPGTEARDFDGSLLWKSAGDFSSCGIGLITQFSGGNEAREKAGGNRTPLTTQYGFKARGGKIYTLLQIASLVPSVMRSQPDREAERLVCLGAHYGFAALRHANRAEWRELWKGRILLHGAEREWQQLADAAFYYMNASVHVSSPASTSMFGLATWHDYHYYYGHVMWDIETFCVPPLIFLQPEAAEALLEYRVRGRWGARCNARAFGRRGIQFPWESAPTTAHEAAPSPGTASWHEDHVSLDVVAARAVRLLAQRALARRRHPHLDRTVVQFLSQLAQVIVWILAVMIFLHVVPALQKLDTALLAGVSLASVVIGLAAQTTLSNFIAGCSLVLYRPFEVDDQIEITGPGGPVIGIIERLTLGYTMLRTFDDRRIIVPNNVMANQISVRGNHAKLRAMAMIPIVVTDAASAGQVKQFLLAEGRAYPGVIDIISCLDQPMEPQGVALSLRLWCRNESIAIKATNDIGAAVAEQSRQAGMDVLIPPTLPLKKDDETLSQV